VLKTKSHLTYRLETISYFIDWKKYAHIKPHIYQYKEEILNHTEYGYSIYKGKFKPISEVASPEDEKVYSIAYSLLKKKLYILDHIRSVPLDTDIGNREYGIFFQKFYDFIEGSTTTYIIPSISNPELLNHILVEFSVRYLDAMTSIALPF